MRGRAPGGARLFFECPNGQKSFKNLVLKSNKNLWGAPAAHFIWNRSASEKLFKNLVQKLIALRAEIILGCARRRTFLGECASRRNLSKSIQNLTESVRMPLAYLGRKRSSSGNY